MFNLYLLQFNFIHLFIYFTLSYFYFYLLFYLFIFRVFTWPDARTCNHAGEEVGGAVVVVVEDAAHEEEGEVVCGPAEPQPPAGLHHA